MTVMKHVHMEMFQIIEALKDNSLVVSDVQMRTEWCVQKLNKLKSHSAGKFSQKIPSYTMDG